MLVPPRRANGGVLRENSQIARISLRRLFSGGRAEGMAP
jgi:hypothetical protein